MSPLYNPASSSGAPVDSPTFTGVPAGPTAAAGTSTTQLATTAFATGAVQNADRTYLQAGIYGTPGNLPPLGSSITQIANRVVISRFTVPRSLTILSGSFAISSVANNDDACMIGIYNGTLTTLLASSLSTTGKMNALGTKSISLQASVTLTPGNVYYSAFVAAVAGTAGQYSATSLVGVNQTYLFSADGTTPTAPTCECARFDAGSVSLPTSPTLQTIGQGPAIAWKT